MASSMVAAADINDTTSTDVSGNINTNTISDDTISTSQNNNIESQTIKKEVDTTDNHETDNTTTTSETKQLIKNDKNLKGYDYSCTLSLNPNTAALGSNITASLSKGIFRSGTSYPYTLYIDNVVIETGNIVASSTSTTSLTFAVPDTISVGSHTVKLSVKYTSSINNVGSATLTIEKTSVSTTMDDMEDVTGEIGNTIIPVTVHDIDGNGLTGSSNVTITDDEDNILIEDYPIENGVASISVPTNKVGTYDLTVNFKGSTDYDPCSNTVTVTVNKAPTTLIVDQDDEGVIYEIINAYENTILTGTLVQTSNNKGLANLPLKVMAGNGVYTVTTDENGKYEFKYDVTEIVEDVPITICFEGNDLYSASEVFEGSFDTEALEVNIQLDDVTLSEVNETTTITGSLTDNYDNSLANVEVNLKINDDEPVTVTTDGEGKFTYDAEFKEVMEVTVETSMKNQELYEADPATTTFNVVVGPKRTSLTIETGRGTDNTIDIIDVTPYFDEVITNGTLIDIFGEPVANAQIKILLNGEDYSQTTDNEGKFSLIYNATEGLTVYNLSVEFVGNDAYKPAGEVYTGKFTSEAFDITVTVDDNFPEEILNGDTVTITGNATLQNQTLKNNPIVLTIDGVKYNTQTDEEGKFTYDYTVARTGNIPVIVNATFANSNVKVAQKTITVAYPEVYVYLDEVSDTTVLSDVTLNGRVYIAQNGTAIEDDLIFKINDEVIPLTTNNDGYFTYTFTPDTVGTYEISIAYESNKYDVQNTTATINVAKRATQLVNDKLPIAVKVDDIFTITGTLIDETNTPITDAEVIFIINNEKYTNTTDVNGHYQYNYQTTTVGDNNLYEVRYSGDDNYALAKNYVGSYFDVETFKAIITVNATDCGMGDSTTITGTVKKSDESPVSNAEILIKINGEEFTVTTNDEGIYEYTYTPSKMGTYTLTATATEFGQATANTTFKVTKPITNIIINPIKTMADQETTITANVTTSDNSPVTGGKVAFKINGKTIKDENGKVIYANVADGKASIPYTFTANNIQGNITAVYSGSTSYNGSHSESINVEIEQPQDGPQVTGVATVTVGDITAVPGETVTIIATVKDGPISIDEGKIVFKIAGKTLKDENGKTLYVKVENGLATLEYTIPETYKVKDYTLKATYMSSTYDKAECEATLTVVKEKTVTDNGTQGLTNTNNGLKADGPTVHVITDENVDDYITATGLSDLVNPGDTLDIQGTIDRQRSLVFNKPVNVISSTQDAVISLHSVSKDMVGSDPGNLFAVYKGASGSNISNLYLYNTQCWIYNTYDVTLYNMTMYVKDQNVGNGVGQTAIRFSERITIDSCNIYTENNGGSTSLALTGASHVLIKNTTIQGVQGSGMVGNILYLGNRNNPNVIPSGYSLPSVDTNITVLNCTLMGECNAAITVLTYYGAVDNVSYINCTLNASGNYATIRVINGSAIGNKFYQKGSIALLGTCEAYDNVFYDNGQMTTYAGTTAYNNTLYTLEYAATGNVYNNTIKSLSLFSNTELSGNVLDGSISIASTSTNSISNVILSNNTMTGNVAITGTITRKTSNLQLVDNDIAGNVTITYATNTKLINNTINGTVTIQNAATGTQIENNTIVTANSYAISNAATSTVVTNNYLISDNYQRLGPNAIYDTARINKANNGPELSDFWTVSIDPVYATIDDDTIIIVDIIDEISGTPIEEGEVYLLINDDIVTDEEGNILKVSVSSSQALFDINSIPREWLRSDAVLTAVYTSGTLTKTNSTNMTILKREANVEITTEELTITPGQTVTLTAKVTDLENGEYLSGQLAFKVDGRSLEDESGKLICVDVVDGIATLEYTFGDDITAGTYTLSAVFENTYYVRSTADKTLVIE